MRRCCPAILRARCADGPYAGQAFNVPRPDRPMALGYREVIPLMWIINGTDRHCYTLARNGHYGDYRLVYRDTF